MRNNKRTDPMRGEPRWKFLLRNTLGVVAIFAAFYALCVVAFVW